MNKKRVYISGAISGEDYTAVLLRFAKSQAVLNESKQLEGEVDSEIQRANNIMNNRQQPSLFDGQ